jgi:hypothetical protein
MDELLAKKAQLDVERKRALKPYKDKVTSLEAEYQMVRVRMMAARDQLADVEAEHDRLSSSVRTKIKHQQQYSRIQSKIKGFEALVNPDTPDRSTRVPSKDWFICNRFCGYALYADGVFDLYSNAGGPRDPHSSRYRPFPILCKFDFYEAYMIAKDTSIPHQERVQKLYALLEAFKVPT